MQAIYGGSMNWFKKHTDTTLILSSFAAALMWMNGRFNEVDTRFAALEKDMAIVKTVMIMKNVMPKELAHAEGQKSE